MKIEPPDDEAYGRVTNPERFLVVVDAARRLIAELARDYEVVVTHGTAAEDFPTREDGTAVTTRIKPTVGAPLRILITDFPGVDMRFGRWGHDWFPSCGCDACDEDPDELIAEMKGLVDAVTGGRYFEELRRRTLTRALTGPHGRRGSRQRLQRRDLDHYGPAGRHEWPAWPKR